MLSRLLTPQNDSFFLFGPRGTGKSTWIRSHYASALNLDLLRTDEALRFGKNPSLLGQETARLKAREWVVIDEVQKVPALLDEVHRLIEERKLRFLLSGSSARKLKRGGANLLAGRAHVTRMFPLVSRELGNQFNLERALQFGLLPQAIASEKPAAFLRAYAMTYLEEEIKAEALTRNIGNFARFLEVAARQNGQITSTSSIARDAQVARQTVQTYFELLIDTLVGFWLPAWKLKRATKQVAHPKFYFFDPGVVRAITERIAYPVQPEEKGSLFESWVMHEVRAYLAYSDLDYPMYFWSSHDGVEVDLLIETQRGFFALEVKSSHRWDKSFSRGLVRISNELKKNTKLCGVYLGKSPLRPDSNNEIQVLDCASFSQALWSGELIQ